MIKGVVHDNRPLISLTVGWQLGLQEIVALVDTGFTGELKISPEKASELGLKPTHVEPVTLGDDNIIDMPASLAMVSMEGTSSIVNVLVADGAPVIGVGLLKRFLYTLNIDFKSDLLELRK